MTDDKPTPDQRVAQKMGIGVNHVIDAREDWNRSPNATIVRIILEDRLMQHHAELMQQFKKCKPEDLGSLQGRIHTLEFVTELITKPNLTNEP